MPRLLRAVLMLWACAAMAGCAPVDLLNATVGTDRVSITRDIAYVPGPGAAADRHTLDVYRPTDRPGPLPVAVFIYGGNWRNGNKSDYLFAATGLARQGMLVFVPDYRLYPQVRFPGFVQDAAQAVAYARKAALSWGGDPHRVFVIGHSAGAHIAAMLALDPEYLAVAGERNNSLAGVICLSGPYDFLPIQSPDVQAVFSDSPDKTVTQPISYANGRNPPMLLLTGAADDTVEPRNTTALADRIRANGGPVETRTYPGVGHLGTVLALAPGFHDRAPTLADITAFVQAH